MKTIALLADSKFSIPASTAWYLDSLGEFRGKQDLYTRQAPQKLRVLREHALIESAVSSNRIEGVSVEPSRIQSVLVATQPLFRDRDEEEVRGYRDALKWIHERSLQIPLDENCLKRMHAMARGQIWDAGQYEEKDGDIIERYIDGQERIRFRPTSARESISGTSAVRKSGFLLPVALAAFNLDFLCIHPFRDGNGRVSRLALQLQTYHTGMEVGRYISLERRIEENEERYYQTLEQCSVGWHEGKHDPWPFINYILSILKLAYQEFEQRVGQVIEPKGAKAEFVQDAVRKREGEFRLRDIEQVCPSVGREWIRNVLADIKKPANYSAQAEGLPHVGGAFRVNDQG